uniref:Uncharacterized protein n=1 Tax=Myoviridae sp. ct8ME27 TaxID=2826622 RepID=A0A8S5N7N1_9CAUD|nr:MAG TPA: hypothetical protein [Myoviridae sp. ct8ME27]
METLKMIPSKLQHGENFKTGVVNKINAIIDYLKTQRLVSDNKTIKINQFTSGVRFISYRQWNNNICNS